MRQFTETYQNWTTADGLVQIKEVSTIGQDLDEMLANAEIIFEDQHGEPTRESWSAGDLAPNDFRMLVEAFSVHLAGDSL